MKERAYLVDTRNLSPIDCAKVEELLRMYCPLHSMVAKIPGTYLAHTSCTVDEFSALPFPDGCTVTDVTHQDLMAYR